MVDCGFSLEDDEELSYDTLAPRRNGADARLSPWPTRSSSWAGATRSACSGWFAGCRSWRVQAPRRSARQPGRSGAVGSNPEQRVSEALARFAGVTEVLFVPDDPAALDTALLEGAPWSVCTRLAGTAGGALDRREGVRRSGRTGPAPPPRLRISR